MVDSLKCSCPLIGRGCKWLGTLNDCEDHLDTCGYVHAQCKLKCGIVIQRNELKLHEEKCPLCIVECKHCKRELKLGSMITHLGLCPKMELPCKMECGVVMCREVMAQHLEQECGLVVETCKLRCGMRIQRNELQLHVKETCVQRFTPCEHCKRSVKFCDMTHLLDRCPKMEVSCELECGVVMCREDMAQHLEQECGLVEEMCELGCGMKLARDELKMHVKETCVQRVIACEHCKRSVKFCDMTIHLDKCPKMEVSCELTCGVVICREDMALHVEQNCPEKEVECPFAKYKYEVTSIKRQHLEAHLENNRTEHMELKLTGLENITTEQSIEIKQMVLEKHLEKERSEHLNSKLNQLEDRLTRISTQNWQGEETPMITINKLSEQINTLCSLNNITKFEWNICDITRFVQILDRQPERRQVGEFTLNIYFERNSICVSFNNKHRSYQKTVVARFMISLYSNTKMRVIKQYKHDISQFPIGGVKQEISCIPNSDVQNFPALEVPMI